MALIDKLPTEKRALARIRVKPLYGASMRFKGADCEGLWPARGAGWGGGARGCFCDLYAYRYPLAAASRFHQNLTATRGAFRARSS